MDDLKKNYLMRKSIQNTLRISLLTGNATVQPPSNMVSVFALDYVRLSFILSFNLSLF